MMPTSVLYSSRAHLNEQDVARVVQASVYIADTVWLPGTATIDPTLPSERARPLERRLRELEEIGALKRWAVETISPTQVTAGHLVTVERYQSIYDSVLDRLMSNRVEFLGEAGRSFDGITEIVLGKQALWHFALCDELDAGGVLYDVTSSANLGRFVRDLVGRMYEADEVVKELELRLHLPDVSAFPVEKLVACREKMPTFRADLLRRIVDETGVPGVTSKELIDRVAGAVVDDFYEYARRAARDEIGRAAQRSPTAWNRLWSVFELLFGASRTTAPHNVIFNWRHEAEASPPPQLLLLEIMKSDQRR